MGFDVVIHDNGSEPKGHPRAIQVIQDDHRYERLLPDADDFVVIATHHKGDLVALNQVLGTNASYIGLVASRHRAALIFEQLQQAGFESQQIRRIKGPAGLAIGSVTYREIALSIVAELVSLRRAPSQEG
jgi:xanthine dehydrogenase accessory factor